LPSPQEESKGTHTHVHCFLRSKWRSSKEVLNEVVGKTN
jgi:hypothetical protein